MPDLGFHVAGAKAVPFSAAPVIGIDLRVTSDVPIQSVLLQVQVRIDVRRRAHGKDEMDRLRDLFGGPDTWNRAAQSLLWANVTLVVPTFERETSAELHVPCGWDFELAASKYLDALEGADVPLALLFSGSVFFDAGEGLQATRVPWSKQATATFPVSLWRQTLDHHRPNQRALSLRQDVYDKLDRFKRESGSMTFEHAIERLLVLGGKSS